MTIGESLVYSIDDRSGRFADYTARHPEIIFVQDSFDYGSTNELAGALLTGAVNCDVFSMSTFSTDVQKIMEMGYCADLSESEIIAALG